MTNEEKTLYCTAFQDNYIKRVNFMRNFNTFFKQRPWLCWLYIAYGTWLLAMPLAAQDISVELDPIDATLSQSIGTSVAIGSQIAVLAHPAVQLTRVLLMYLNYKMVLGYKPAKLYLPTVLPTTVLVHRWQHRAT